MPCVSIFLCPSFPRCLQPVLLSPEQEMSARRQLASLDFAKRQQALAAAVAGQGQGVFVPTKRVRAG